MKIKAKEEGASFDVVVIVDPLSKGILLINLYLASFPFISLLCLCSNFVLQLPAPKFIKGLGPVSRKSR